MKGVTAQNKALTIFIVSAVVGSVSGEAYPEEPHAEHTDQPDPACKQVEGHTNVEAQMARQDQKARDRARAWQHLTSAEMRSLAQAARVLLRNDAV